MTGDKKKQANEWGGNARIMHTLLQEHQGI